MNMNVDIGAEVVTRQTSAPTVKGWTMADLISREDAIRAMLRLECEDIEAYGAKIPEGFDAEPAVEALKALPSAQQWIPVTERLPEEDVEVLISYRYKEGEGDTSHTDVDITTYGQMYFGGNKVGNHKHWRPPFEYFASNYEVVAWMPLPEPYREEDDG